MNDKRFSSKSIEELNDKLNEKIDYLINNNFCLTESDFYPPSDNRNWLSNIIDIDGGDNFADYCEHFFEMLDQEEYFEN